jgi:hypothetical protein
VLFTQQLHRRRCKLMSLYNQSLYNNILYNNTGEATQEVVQADLSLSSIKPEVDKYISPYYKRFFPEFMHSDYSTFLTMFRYYLEYLENSGGVYWAQAHLPELAAIQTTIDSNLNNIREQYAPDFIFEDFPLVDKRKFLENSKRYFSIKGNDQSFKFLFRMLGKEIDIKNPLDDTLFIGEHSVIGDEKLTDSFYFTPYTYDIRTDMPYGEWNQFIRKLNHPIGTQMFGTYLLFLGDRLLSFPGLNTTIPNKPDNRVFVSGDISSTIQATGGDIIDFPDPTASDSLPTLIIRVGSEDMRYIAKDDIGKTITVSERGVNDTRETNHLDRSEFTVDIDNDYLILSDRLHMYTGKKCSITSTVGLPVPFLPAAEYYVSVIEIKGILEGSIGAGDTSLELEDGTGFPDSGTMYINGELISYSNKTGNLLGGLTRGRNNTIAVPHDGESKVYFWDRVIRLSESPEDVLDRRYINIADNGLGTHEFIGSGQEITLFTGFNVARPQTLLVRELNAFTSYEDIQRDIFSELNIQFNYRSDVSVDLNTNVFTTSSNHPFYFMELVRFTPKSTGLTSNIGPTDTIIPVDSTTGFNSTGSIRINAEWISYTGITATTFTGLSRGSRGTSAASHAENSCVTARLYETTGGIELDGTFIARRIDIGGGIGNNDNQFTIISDINNPTVPIDITSQSSSTVEVDLHCFNGSSAWSDGAEIYQPSTMSSGTIRWNPDAALTGRNLIVDIVPGVYGESQGYIDNIWESDSEIIVRHSDGNLVSTGGKVIKTTGDYNLTEYDFNDLTISDLEDGGASLAKELRFRLSEIREEVPIDINTKYHVPILTEDVQLDSNWGPDISTSIASWNQTSVGHISLSNAQGICRGFLAPNRPVIEIVQNSQVILDHDTLGDIVATVGSSTITGDFSNPPSTIDQSMSVCIEDDVYKIQSSTTTSITFTEAFSKSGMVNGDVLITEGFLQHMWFPGTGGSTGTGRAWIGPKDGYALGLGTSKKYVKMRLDNDIAINGNWSVSTEPSYNPNLKGHISQIITNAQGIIRAKPTVQSTLNGAISDVDNTIVLQDTTQFEESGRCRVDNELFTYASKSPTALLGVVRATHATNAALHQDGSVVTSANAIDEEANLVYVEVISGTFSTQITDSVTVGNGTTSNNDIRLINSIEAIDKAIPNEGQLVSNNAISSSDPNGFRVWEVTESVNINNENIIVLDNIYSLPIDVSRDNGTLNILNEVKE